MNKSQIILSAIGGTVVLGALVLGYFIWDASSAKAEKSEALEDSLGTAAEVVRKLPVKPQKKELAVYKDNCEAYGNWRAEAAKIAARGDLVFEKTTPAVFKTAIVADARKLADLPGCFDGKLVKPDFHFGFKDYITGGALPPDDAAALKRLQREWNDVSSVLKTIAECGGVSAGIVDVRMGKAQKAEAAEEEEQPANKKRKAKKAKKAAKAAEAEEASAEGPAITSFAVDFMARPSGLVKAINAFATGPRFVVVENCTFVREKDEVAENLGGDSKKAEQQAATGRRRRRQQQAQEEKKEDAKAGQVTDPVTAPLLKVTMAFSVYDFRTLEQERAESADDKAKQAEEEK